MPSGIPSADASGEFSPTPLLDAFENFRGSLFDLDRELRITHEGLKKLKSEIRCEMTKHGIASGDRFVAVLPNGAYFIAVWAASLELGASPILMHADTPAAELDRSAQRWGASFVVSEAVGTRDGDLCWRRVDCARPDPLRLCSVPLHPTSGTSSSPKIAIRPGPCAVAEPLHYIETLGLDQSDVILCVTPMSHAYAYGICFLAALLTSAELLFMRRFNPDLVLNALNSRNVSVFPAVPIILETILAQDPRRLLGRPRIVLSAGAPLTKKTFQAFRDRFGLSIRPLYGTTETGGIAVGSGDDAMEETVGPPMRGVEVDLRALGEDNSSTAPKILRVRSSSMMAGYLEDGAISRAALTDGWFETGDLAHIDAHGRIHLQGRLSEVINVFGLKVLPREVEEVITLLDQVAEVKVYGTRWRGQEVVEAAVVRRAKITEEQILAHCDRHLVAYKCPSAIRFVDALPRTPSGKVAVQDLASEA